MSNRITELRNGAALYLYSSWVEARYEDGEVHRSEIFLFATSRPLRWFFTPDRAYRAAYRWAERQQPTDTLERLRSHAENQGG